MTKPILFKPGDVLTAELINKYLVEDPQAQLDNLKNQIEPELDKIPKRVEKIKKLLAIRTYYYSGGTKLK